MMMLNLLELKKTIVSFNCTNGCNSSLRSLGERSKYGGKSPSLIVWVYAHLI